MSTAAGPPRGRRAGERVAHGAALGVADGTWFEGPVIPIFVGGARVG